MWLSLRVSIWQWPWIACRWDSYRNFGTTVKWVEICYWLISRINQSVKERSIFFYEFLLFSLRRFLIGIRIGVYFFWQSSCVCLDWVLHRSLTKTVFFFKLRWPFPVDVWFSQRQKVTCIFSQNYYLAENFWYSRVKNYYTDNPCVCLDWVLHRSVTKTVFFFKLRWPFPA